MTCTCVSTTMAELLFVVPLGVCEFLFSAINHVKPSKSFTLPTILTGRSPHPVIAGGVEPLRGSTCFLLSEEKLLRPSGIAGVISGHMLARRSRPRFRGVPTPSSAPPFRATPPGNSPDGRDADNRSPKKTFFL